MLKDILEDVSGLEELNGISDFLQDETLDECLMDVVKLMTKIDTLTPNIASRLIVKLSAISFTFKMRGKYWMLMDKEGDPGGKKKNLYLSLNESLDRLCDNLKYVARV